MLNIIIGVEFKIVLNIIIDHGLNKVYVLNVSQIYLYL